MTSITVTGNMTATIELRYTQSGKAVGNVTVAENRKKGDQDVTDYHRVTLWEELAEHAAQLDKGTRVIVTGRLESREYEHEGQKRIAWEITATSFGPDLRFATAVVTKTAPRSQRQPADDPWAATPPAQDVWEQPTFDDGTPF